MQINIIAVGKNMPTWVSDGYAEYANRMPSDYRVQLIEISPEKRMKNSDIVKIIALEEAKISAAIQKGSYCIALDRIGKTGDTKTLAKRLQTWHDSQQEICFVIGGPEGLSEAFLKNADEIWSLSAMTLPHPLVRIVLSEQIYRAWSITINHPYHR
ncbi:MAG: 23S rRNA (pseudouridine(1915)-N(3))-methyltransferase RlmH [Gammaproteobacteria bacterium RIFCSPHIGHO2_12_FULL_40_19]|nr:MAG: 23S rRNA (pseudouridine(1915)-N(3))-methyltransferase RlmH [Gammaproteobacteria bacterium RIFCSPHIGHO2_12_FULL_40_19]